MKKNNPNFRYMNTDYYCKNPENYVDVEKVAVTKDEPIRVDHDIFFENGFTVYTDQSDKAGSMLRRGIDYEFCDEDSIATEMSNRNCYKRFIVHTDDAFVFVSYRVYGDFVSAEFLNEVKSVSTDVNDTLINYKAAIDRMEESLLQHLGDTTQVHGSDGTTATPNTIASRTETGTLIVSDATEPNEAATLGQLTTEATTLNGRIENNKSTLDYLTDVATAAEPAIRQEDFLGEASVILAPTGNGGTPEDLETKAAELLYTRANQMLAFYNAIRNENGSLAVPTATKPNEAVNKQQLESYLDSRFTALVGAAPQSLDTLEEIAQALNKDPDMYSSLETAIATRASQALEDAKSYTDEKLATFPTYTPPVYSTTSTMASPTGEILFTADGTRHEIKRLSVELHSVQNNFVVDTSSVGTITKVVRVDGVLTVQNGDMTMIEPIASLVQLALDKMNARILGNITNKSVTYDIVLFIDFI